MPILIRKQLGQYAKLLLKKKPYSIVSGNDRVQIAELESLVRISNASQFIFPGFRSVCKIFLVAIRSDNAWEE
jgi:hypothetical protein